MPRRCVLHLDVDNFYCAVELADDPSLAGRPVAVQQSNSGGFVALSAEAKAAGLRKGDGVGAQGRAHIAHLVEMRSIGLAEARRKCPGLTVLPMRVERYREAGAAILAVLQRFRAPVEKTSYDDFYVDATGAPANPAADAPRVWNGGAFDDLDAALRRGAALAAEMRAAVRAELGFAVSAGVARTKLVARLLSPAAKPDGLLCVRDADAAAFMESRALRSIPRFQAKTGRALAEAIARAMPAGGAAADGGRAVTLGDAIALGRALERAVGAEAAARLRRAAAGDDGGAAVRARGPPRQLATEASFPPEAEPSALRRLATTLCMTLLRRLAEDGRRPSRLVVTWRDGYGDGGESTRGRMHSRRERWPCALIAATVDDGDDATDGDDGDDATNNGGGGATGSPIERGADAAAADALASAALRILLAATAESRRITRLIVAADFGERAPAAAGARALTLDRWVANACGDAPPPVTARSLPTAPTAEDIDLATLAELPPELQDELRAQMAAERTSRRKRSAVRSPAPGSIRAFLKPRT